MNLHTLYVVVRMQAVVSGMKEGRRSSTRRANRHGLVLEELLVFLRILLSFLLVLVASDGQTEQREE